MIFLLFLFFSESAIFFVPTINAIEPDGTPKLSAQNDGSQWIAKYTPKNNSSSIYEHNVSYPFGVNEGNIEDNQVKQAFNIEWSRNNLEWNSIEKANGTFCFNGYSIINETYTSEEINGVIVHLRYYKFDVNTKITAYLENEKVITFNLFLKKINDTAFELKIPLYIGMNKTLLVSYNKSGVSPLPYLEEYVNNYMNNSQNNYNNNSNNILPVLDFSNKYLYDVFEQEYISKGFNVNGFNTAQPDYIPSSADWNWVRYINKTVTRYKGYVHVWEIGNEPNNIYSPDQWNAYLYNIILKAAIAIKTIDPTAKVYIGALGNTREIEFLQAIFEKLLNNPQHPEYRDYFDGITFQSDETVPGNLITEKLNSYLKILNENQWTPSNGKEFLINDIGISTNRTIANNYERDTYYNQASNIVKTMVIAADLGVSLFTWNCYKDSNYGTEKDYLYPELFYGIFDNNLNPKMGAYAFNTTSYLLSNSIARRGSIQYQIDSSVYFPNNHIYGYNFRRGDGTEILIIWNDYRISLNATLTIPGGLQKPIYQYSFTNNSKTLLMNAGSNSTQYNFGFGYDPVIITYQPNVQNNHIEISIIGDSYLRFVVWIEPALLLALLAGSIIYFTVKRPQRYTLVKNPHIEVKRNA